MPSRRNVAAFLLLLAVGCAGTPRKLGEGTYVPLAPRAQPVDQLLANLRSPVPGTRASAAWQFADAIAPDPTVIDALRTAYADPDERVREAAAWALGHLVPVPLYDEAPRPVRISRPQYPRRAFDAKVEGTVLLEILISSSGGVVHAEVRRSIPGLDEAAVDCVKQWSFEPAFRAGKPVPTMAAAPVTFRIY
jgi:TonB family protein